MKKNLIILFYFILLSITSYPQIGKDFTIRNDVKLNGDMLLIGNNILNREDSWLSISANDPCNDDSLYNSQWMNFIDIDSDATTFSSSTATLTIPVAAGGCSKIVYAALYWGALVTDTDRHGMTVAQFQNKIKSIKLKTPTGAYNDVAGTIIFDDASGTISSGNYPYACYADVTNLLKAEATPNGDYTVANVFSSFGYNGGTGLCAGWTLFVIYADPSLPNRFITSFDGLMGIDLGTSALDIPISGFKSMPTGPVRAKLAFSALEGDKMISGDYLSIKKTQSIDNFQKLSTTTRPIRNFFRSSISDINGDFPHRIPNSTNTLGYDAGILQIPNPTNSVIGPGDTSTTIRIGTTQDILFYFFNAFSIDIVEPNIVLTNAVKDTAGNSVAAGNVSLGQTLIYEVTYQNIGNEGIKAPGLKIVDIIPKNLILDATSLNVTNAGNPIDVVVDNLAVPNKISMTIPATSLEVGDPAYKFSFTVKVSPSCDDFITPPASGGCANEVRNQASGTYTGISSTTETSIGSIAALSNCNIGTPSPTNFIVGTSGCLYNRNEILCGNSATISATAGYGSYLWSTGATTRSITVGNTGTFTVENTPTDPTCLSVRETFTVSNFNTTITNPIASYADQVVSCSADGTQLPYIFLCGATDTRAIALNLTVGGATVKWYKLNESSCTAVTDEKCPNTSNSCTWGLINTGLSYTLTDAGQYKMELVFTNGCFNIYYFNVYKNSLSPTVTATNIFCNTPGSIIVGGTPAGYEYKLGTGSYQDSNVFSITTPNVYTVYVKQKLSTTNPCVFSVPNITVSKTDISLDITVTNPLCSTDRGSIKVVAKDVQPQYTYKISKGGVLINQIISINASDYTFSNLNAGTYTIEVTTSDSCSKSQDVDVATPQLFSATSSITKPLTTCSPGEITVSPAGGTAPYSYYVNGATNFQGFPIVDVTAVGTYNIDIVDNNNCRVSTSTVVTQVPAPTFAVAGTSSLCANEAKGKIIFSSIVPNGNTLRYCIDFNSTTSTGTFVNSPTFTDLADGTYKATVEYTYGGVICYSAPQTIGLSSTVAPIVFTATKTTELACGTAGEITINTTISGGTAPYQASKDGVNFINLSSSSIFGGLTAGTYAITIKDSNGCTVKSPDIVFDALDPPSITSVVGGSVNCTTVNTDITVTAIKGIGTKTYMYYNFEDGKWYPGGTTNPPVSGQTSNIFNLPAGNYSFRVVDSRKCFDSASLVVAKPPLITITGTLVNNVICASAANGKITYSLSNLVVGRIYTYNIDGGTTTNYTATATTYDITYTGAAGSHVLTVLDSVTGCSVSSTVVIDAPSSLTPLDFTYTTEPVKCNINGSLNVTATNGWGSYTYTLTPSAGVVQMSNTFTNIAAGIYTIKVKDIGGCEVSKTFTLVSPTSPTATIDTTSDFCYDGTNAATIVVSATAGTGSNLVYSIGGAFQSSNSFPNLTPGTYTVSVKDDYACTVTLSAVIIANDIRINGSVIKDLDCKTTPLNNAKISGNITGGYADFKYYLSTNGVYGVAVALGAGITTVDINALAASAYKMKVEDSKGCIAESNLLTITALTALTATVSNTNLSCFADNNGTVTINASGGKSTYTYSFNNAAFVATNSFSNILAGTYDYSVKDIDECTYSSTVTLTQPAAALAGTDTTVPFKCNATNGKESATITLGATGGTLAYLYSFDNGTSYSSNNLLTVNDYTTAHTINYKIKDGNNCVFSSSVNLAKLEPPTDFTVTSTPILCTPATSTTSTATISAVIGGKPSLNYSLTFPISSSSSNTTGIFSNLTSDTYIFEVKDANNCSYTKSHLINPSVPINIGSSITSNVTCKGTTDGKFTFTITGYSSTYSYTLVGTDGSTISASNVSNATLILSNLKAQSYTFTVVDEVSGCTKVVLGSIAEPAVSLDFTYLTDPIKCTEKGKVTVSATAGWGVFSYAISPSTGVIQNSNVFTNLVAGNYTLSVTDYGGCVVSKSFTLTDTTLTPPTVTVDTTNSDLCYDSTNFASIKLIAANGRAPYLYSIDGGVTYQTSDTFTNLAPGTYDKLKIIDANNCQSATITQIIGAELTVSTTLTKRPDCTASPNFIIDGVVTGGATPFSCTLNTTIPITITANNFSYTDAPPSVATDYIFKVTDNNGCSVTSTAINVGPIVNPVILPVTPINNKCSYDTTGKIQGTIDLTKGTAPYTVKATETGGAIYAGTVNTSTGVFELINLPIGAYSIVVTDSKSCSSTAASATLSSSPISWSHTETPVTCIGVTGNELGKITTNSTTGGVAPFTFELIDQSATPPATPIAAISPGNYENLNAASYKMIIKDSNLCIYTENVIIISSPTILSYVANTADCSNGATVTLRSTGGVGNLFFAIYTQTGMTYPGIGVWQGEDLPYPPNSRKSTFTGLSQGVSYTFIVYDTGTSCYYTETMPPTAKATQLVATPSNIKPTCSGTTGSVDINLVFAHAISPSSIDYRVVNSSTGLPTATGWTLAALPANFTVSNLAAGSYYVEIRENGGSFGGCISATPVFVIEQASVPLTIAANVTRNDNCTGAGGIIELSANGGAGSYQFQVLSTGSPAPTPPGGGTWVSTTTFTRNAGVYDVYVLDSYNCIATLSVPVTLISDDPVASAIVVCDSKIKIDLTSPLAPLPSPPYLYSIDNGVTYQNAVLPVTVALAPATYSVTVKDANNCISPVVSVTLNTQLAVSTATTPITCVSNAINNDGKITVTATGGTSPYTYSILPATGSLAGTVFSSLPHGTYSVTVTDANSCTKSVSNIILEDPTPVTFDTATISLPKCNSGTDGSITVNLATGNNNPNYKYEITSTPVVASQDSNIFYGLVAGTYTVQVTSARGCVATQSVTIAQPTAITETHTLVGLKCGANNAVQSATVTMTAAGGTSPYLYSFDAVTYSNTNTFTTSTAGTVNVSIKDANNCLLATTVAVTALSPPTDMSFNIVLNNCPAATPTVTNSTVTIAPTGGVANFEYSILSPSTATTNVTGKTTGIFTDLLEDDYMFEIKDANNCRYSESVLVKPAIINSTLLSKTDVSCNSGIDGKIEIAVGGFAATSTSTPPYGYNYIVTKDAINYLNGANQVASSLSFTVPKGSYSVLITDNVTSCNITTLANIFEPTAAVDFTIVNVNANCNNDAQITVTATGGSPAYTYAFKADATSSITTPPVSSDFNISNSAQLNPTTSAKWDVWVKDTNGCLKSTQDITISTDNAPTIAFTPVTHCFDNNPYDISLNGAAGVAPLLYSIGGVYQASQIFSINAPGTYTLYVKDSNSCIATTTYEVKPIVALTATLSNDLTCAADASISLSPLGGTGTYTLFESSADNGVTYVASVNPFVATATGTYKFRVTDSNSCTAISNSDITVTPKTTPTITLTSTIPKCNGGTDGGFSMTAAAGLAPYKYSIDGGTNYQVSNSFAGLSAGTYNIIVKDTKDCVSATTSQTLVAPAAIAFNTTQTAFTCNSTTNVLNPIELQITAVSGGTAPYSYSFDGVYYSFTDRVNVSDIGVSQTVSAYVKDANACVLKSNVTVNAFQRMSVPTITRSVAITCLVEEEITVVPASTDCTQALGCTYTSLNNSADVSPNPVGSSSFKINKAGTYNFKMIDNTTQCFVETQPHVITAYDTMVVNASTTTVASCFGDAVTMNVSVTGYTGAYTYKLLDGLGATAITGAGNTATNPLTFSFTEKGSLTVQVKDSNFSCEKTSNAVSVSPFVPLALTATQTSEVTCSNNKGTIVAETTGGRGVLQFELSGTKAVAYSASRAFTDLGFGNYTVKVKDDLNCVVSANITLSAPTPITFTALANPAPPNKLNCFGDTNALITLSGTTGGQGAGNYSYSLAKTSVSPPINWAPQASTAFSALGAGTYEATASDGWSCKTVITPITIQEPTAVKAQLVLATGPTCALSPTITLTASGGTAPYLYNNAGTWQTLSSPLTITVPLASLPINKVFDVKDTNSCATTSNDLYVNPIQPLTMSLDLSNAKVLCNGASTATIKATGIGALGNYVYTLLDGAGNPIASAVQTTAGYFTQLPAGNYKVKVQSGDCATTSSAIAVTEPASKLVLGVPSTNIANVTCFGSDNGRIEAVASGGTGTIQYAISDKLNQFFDDSVFNNLSPKAYDIIVQDRNGCYHAITARIQQPLIISPSTVDNSIKPELCEGDLNGEFKINIAGGTPAYSVSIDDEKGTYVPGAATQTEFHFTDLRGGKHLVYIKDTNTCLAQWEVNLPPSVNLDAEVDISYNCSQQIVSNLVEVTLKDTSADATLVTYSFDGDGIYTTEHTYKNVLPGTHFVFLKHTNGCIDKTADFVVNDVKPVSVKIVESKNLNELVADIKGGVGPFDISFNGVPQQEKQEIIVFQSGMYDVLIHDSLGCYATDSVYYEFIDILIPNVFTPNGDGINDGWKPLNTENYPEIEILIYDRQNRHISTLKSGGTWNGVYDFKSMPAGDYWYILKLNHNKDSREFVGNFTLYR